jgi:CBS domain-containing protein
MRYRGVRRLPVVDREGALVGVAALDDLLEYIADELAGIARVSSRGRHEQRKRRA